MLPVGTLVITEKKAPEGYHINPVTIVKNIKPEGVKDGEAYVTPKIKEDSVSVKIIKVQDGNNIRISDTVFRHTMPDGTTKDYTTDENGEIQLQGLGNRKASGSGNVSGRRDIYPIPAYLNLILPQSIRYDAITQLTENMGISLRRRKKWRWYFNGKNKLAHLS